MRNQHPQFILVTADAQECVQLIFDQAAVASERELPGLTSALECLLSLDDRDAGQLVAKLRRADVHSAAEPPRTSNYPLTGGASSPVEPGS
jgi:hypothetical protein